MPDAVSATKAIVLIDALRRRGIAILGVEGFLKHPHGLEAKLDLILDISKTSKDVVESAIEAKDFIEKHANEMTLFEVVY